ADLAAGTGGLPAGAVLMVDGYEQLTPIDEWLRQEFIPQLAADTVVVLAGREAPAAAWRVDSGWRRLVAVHELGPLDPAESDRLLAHAGVAAADRPRLLVLGRGHPLAMALLADVARTGTVPERLADVPGLVTTLLDSLLRGAAPTRAHLAGLAACATAWVTTEDLLREVVGPSAPEVWEWLRRRPFIVDGPTGLTPHDLARDVLEAEFERRAPDWYRAVHRSVHDHAVAGLRTAAPAERHLRAPHLLHQHRRAPFSAALQVLRAQGSTAVVPGRSDDHAEVVSLIERIEGADSARLAAAWLAEVPDGPHVVRTGRRVAGFTFQLTHPTRSTPAPRDPVVRAVLDHVAAAGPTRPGEQVLVCRFTGGRHAHQRDPYAAVAAPVSSLVAWVTQPLAWSFLVVVDPGYWGPVFDYLGFARLVEVDIGGRTHVGYGMDWRRLPVAEWLDLMSEREYSGGAGPPPASRLRPPPLGRPDFDAAVRAALRDLARPDRLATNPLTSSGLAVDAATLRATLLAAVDHLRREPKGARWAAVLDRTFVRAATTQEAAAEVLGLPFSTYRRHLARALDELTDLLWAVEIGELRLATGPDSN